MIGEFGLIPDRDAWMLVTIAFAWFGPPAIVIGIIEKVRDGVAERWVGSCRRELLEHVIVLNEQHLLRLLREFLDYYHNDRTHLSLGKDPPTTRAACPQICSGATVASLSRVGGLHHRYEWRDAA